MAEGPGGGTAGVTVRFDVPATMADGVVLASDVYAPAAGDDLPTLLLRTPYGKQTVLETAWTGIDPVAAAQAGFLVVIQDTRGRFASGGEWEPLRHEASDGAESVEWAARLPRSSGRVAMFGGSYSGSTQWQAALEQPPSLAALSATMTWADPRDGVFSRGGVLELGLDLPWSLVTGIDDLVRRHGDDEVGLMTRIDAVLDELDDLGEAGYRRPREVLARHGVRDLGSLAAVDRGPVASTADLAGRQRRAGVPTLHTGGWYDIFLQGTIDNHLAMVEAGHDSWLVVGPWSHENFTQAVGQVDFGIRARRDSPAVLPPVGPWPDAQLAWLRHHLEAAPVPLDLPRVRVFVMGRNQWRTEAVWPPASARDTEVFLHPDGGLAPVPSAAGPATIGFSYDPADPVPTVGGNTFMTAQFPAGPFDQSGVEARADVLTFTSEVLDTDLEVAGRVRAHLVASSSAPTVDWVVRLCDVHPDGRSINVCDGVLRVEGADQPRAHTIDLWSTSMVFLAGHRLRVHVTTSSFPRWETTGLSDTGGTHRAVIHVGGEHRSTLVLPVLPPTGDSP